MNAIAQTKATGDTIAIPAITGFGKDDGVKSEIKISSAGGRISSSDGVVTLIFPEDALSGKTNISIQPVTNLAPNGNGKAYRMEPSGITFKKNATIVFNYSNEDTANNAQAFMDIAMQDENGKWYKLNKTVKDTVAKTITGSIKHFSYYVNFSKAKITPGYTRLKVNGTLRLKIVGAFGDDTDEDEELIPLKIEYPTMNWKVNGIEKGNSTVGLISASTNGTAIFKAPEKVPAQNPVAINVQQTYNSNFVKRYGNNYMVSNILIYDNAYKVTMIHSIYEAPSAGLFMAVNYKDTGSFIVSITGKEATVIEKENRNTTSNLDYKGKCKVQQLQPGTGSIHILGVSSIRIIEPTTPGGNHWVEIFFKRAPTIIPSLKFTCPPVGGRGDDYTGTNEKGRVLAASMISAFPMQVRFELKDEDQTILQIGKEGDNTYVKFTVKKLKDE